MVGNIFYLNEEHYGVFPYLLSMRLPPSHGHQSDHDGTFSYSLMSSIGNATLVSALCPVKRPGPKGPI